MGRLVVCADLRPTSRPGIVGEEIPTHELILIRYGSGRAVFQKTDVGNSSDVEACVKKAADLGKGRLDMQVSPFPFFPCSMHSVHAEWGVTNHLRYLQ